MFALIIFTVRRLAPDIRLSPTQGPACTRLSFLSHQSIKAAGWFLSVVLWSFADRNTIFHVGETTFTEDKVNEYKCQFVKGAF